jgi:hypothetical protein
VKQLDNFKSLAGIYYLGIGCGIWEKVEVIDWCDKVIAAMDNPPYEIIEVSLMSKSKINDIENKLYELCEFVDDEYTVDINLAIMLEKLIQDKISLEQAIRTTTRMLVHTGLSWESMYYRLYSFDDSYDLAVDGIFELTNVKAEFIDELMNYKEYINEFKKLYYNVTTIEWKM